MAFTSKGLRSGRNKEEKNPEKERLEAALEEGLEGTFPASDAIAVIQPVRERTIGSRMTKTLAEKKCTPCRGGIPPLTRQEAGQFQSHTPSWVLRDDSHRIERTFHFRNFKEALGFVRNVGDLAETEGHHPDISFGWGYATISLRTKKIKGLHENDFIMASKIDQLLDRLGGS